MLYEKKRKEKKREVSLWIERNEDRRNKEIYILQSWSTSLVRVRVRSHNKLGGSDLNVPTHRPRLLRHFR